MQTEKSQPEGKQIIPETRFTDFLAFSVDRMVGISRSASETKCLIIFLTHDIKNLLIIIDSFFYFLILYVA